MAALIEATNLSHFFGDKMVLDNISLSIEQGQVIGLLGPSGAGKTTLVNILTGQLQPSRGSVALAKENAVNGIMMDSFGLYGRLTVWDNLKLFADIYGVPSARIDHLLERAELTGAKNTVVGNLSKGMRSRVNFCRALLKDVDILYLDEPTSGLDPATTKKIHTLIREENQKNTTIFLTTHNMHEAETLCDIILLLNEGHVVERGTPRELCVKYNIENTISLVLENGGSCTLPNNRESAQILYEKMTEDKLVSIHSSEPDLEDVFLKLTGRKLDEA